MIVNNRLKALASKLRKEGYYIMAEEIDHVMLQGELRDVEVLVTIF